MTALFSRVLSDWLHGEGPEAEPGDGQAAQSRQVSCAGSSPGAAGGRAANTAPQWTRRALVGAPGTPASGLRSAAGAGGAGVHSQGDCADVRGALAPQEPPVRQGPLLLGWGRGRRRLPFGRISNSQRRCRTATGAHAPSPGPHGSTPTCPCTTWGKVQTRCPFPPQCFRLCFLEARTFSQHQTLDGQRDIAVHTDSASVHMMSFTASSSCPGSWVQDPRGPLTDVHVSLGLGYSRPRGPQIRLSQHW